MYLLCGFVRYMPRNFRHKERKLDFDFFLRGFTHSFTTSTKVERLDEFIEVILNYRKLGNFIQLSTSLLHFFHLYVPVN